MPARPFWEEPLERLDAAEWEALCDGCARCCLIKLEDEESGELHYTNVVCRYLDRERCRCTTYDTRSRTVPDCLDLRVHEPATLTWMPVTCAYRLRAEGRALPPWHPLLSGDPETVHTAGISVRSFAISEEQVAEPDALEEHIVDSIR